MEPDPEAIKSNPLFGKLCIKLDERLSINKSSLKAQKEFDQAKKNLFKARSEWLTNKILFNEVHEIVTDLETQKQAKSLSNDEERFHDVLVKMLSYAELPDYLDFCPSASSKSSLFGITDKDVDRHNPVKRYLPDVLQIVIPRVEEKLEQKCRELHAFADPCKSEISSYSLPQLVEEKKAHLVKEKTRLEEKQEGRDCQFWSYFQKLLECLQMIECLIKDFKCSSKAETDKVTSQYLLASSQATSLKLRLAQLHLERETYSPETVKALKIVNYHLDECTSQAKKELSAVSHNLDAYQSLGPELAALASQVSQLQKELSNKRWGLQQFGQESSSSH